jgi:hypothetical protein
LQYRLRRIVRDGVSLQHVLNGRDFPREPALRKRRVHAQQVRKVADLAAAAADVVLDALGNGLDFALLAVSAAKLETADLKWIIISENSRK